MQSKLHNTSKTCIKD